MKKICSVSLACVMVVAMAVTAFAANGSPVEDVKVVEGTAKDKDGNTLPGSISDYVSVGDATQQAPAEAGQKLLATADVKLENGATSATVVLSVVGVKKGETVLLKLYANGKWTVVEGVAVADNQVEVTVNESGTLAVYVAENAGEGSTGNGSTGNGSTGAGTTGSGSTGSGSTGSGSGAGSATSPKTGETSAVAVAAMMAVVLACGAVAAFKKVNA